MGFEGKRRRLQSKIELKNRLQRPKTDQIFEQISRSETIIWATPDFYLISPSLTVRQERLEFGLEPGHLHFATRRRIVSRNALGSEDPIDVDVQVVKRVDTV